LIDSVQKDGVFGKKGPILCSAVYQFDTRLNLQVDQSFGFMLFRASKNGLGEGEGVGAAAGDRLGAS
jgi:hypothetical protein